MKTFTHAGKEYIRVIPSKFMMNSTMIYEITTRGDILAMEVESQKLVVIKGTEQVVHNDMVLMPGAKMIADQMKQTKELDFS